MSRFSDAAVMHKELIQSRDSELTGFVLLLERSYVQLVLICVRFVDRIKVALLDFRWRPEPLP